MHLHHLLSRCWISKYTCRECQLWRFISGIPKTKEKHPTTTRMEKIPLKSHLSRLAQHLVFPVGEGDLAARYNKWSDLKWCCGSKGSWRIPDDFWKFYISLQSFKLVVICRYPPEIHLLNFSKRIIRQLCPGMASQHAFRLPYAVGFFLLHLFTESLKALGDLSTEPLMSSHWSGQVKENRSTLIMRSVFGLMADWCQIGRGILTYLLEEVSLLI